jgi:hypothetical protein
VFREFGIPARIEKVKEPERFVELREQYSNKRNCYISVYAFSDEREGKTDYDSAILNTLWFDFDESKDVSKTLKDVKKLYTRYCKPLGIEPRIFYTGGRGFQVNIDLPLEGLNLGKHIKRKSLRDYLLHLQNKYTLTTLDKQCINNSVSAMRRMPYTPYLDKKTMKPNGRYCIPISISQLMNMNMDEIEEMSTDTNSFLPPESWKPSLDASKDFLFFICDELGISYTPTNSINYLLDKINETDTIVDYTQTLALYRMSPRECVLKLIDKCIVKGHSGHTENNIIATELIHAGWSNDNIAATFKFIYDEEGGDYGWYTNDDKAGYQIRNLRAKGINRYSKDRLIELKICKTNCACSKR